MPVIGVHDGSRVLWVRQTQRVAKLMSCNSKQAETWATNESNESLQEVNLHRITLRTAPLFACGFESFTFDHTLTQRAFSAAPVASFYTWCYITDLGCGHREPQQYCGSGLIALFWQSAVTFSSYFYPKQLTVSIFKALTPDIIQNCESVDFKQITRGK